MNLILESFNGKTISSVAFTDIYEEELEIKFTDGTNMRIASSEWLTIDSDEFREKQRLIYEENLRRQHEEQEARDAKLRKQYPGLV